MEVFILQDLLLLEKRYVLFVVVVSDQVASFKKDTAV